jgi:carboxypeptidase family protein/MMPL family protein
VFGTALGAGIVIDATVVRALLVPALVSLFGRWNWWLPDRLATLLRVGPSPVDSPQFTGDWMVAAPDPEPVTSGSVDGPEPNPMVKMPVIAADSAPDPEPMISGSVRGQDRGALVGVPVTLIDTGGRQIALFRTGPEGSYCLRAPSAGSYLLAASASGHHPAAFLITVLDHPVQQEIVLSNHYSADPALPREAVYELGANSGDYW